MTDLKNKEEIEKTVEENKRRYDIEYPIWYNAFHKNAQKNCNHEDYFKDGFKTYDWINGFELIDFRCGNCGKILELHIRAFKRNKFGD